MGAVMTHHRRQFLYLTAGAAALPMLACYAWAEAYPAKPVNLIVTFPAGSGPDIIGRLAGQWLSEHLGQQFVIENKPGFNAAFLQALQQLDEPTGDLTFGYPAKDQRELAA